MSKPKKKPDAAAEDAAQAGAEPTPEPREDDAAGQAPAGETAAGSDGETAADGAAAGSDGPDPVAELQAERDALHEKWLRTVAELDNVRKRAARDVQQSRRFAQADVLRAFLDVADNFERALQTPAGDEDTGDGDAFRAGIELIHQRLRTVLRDQGVTAMEVLGQPFDPNVHEAVAQLEREGAESGVVIEVVQTGYHFGDMVLRPARVVIST